MAEENKPLENLELVEMANKIFREAKIKEVFTLLNRVKDKETESYIKRKLKDGRIGPIGIVYEDPSISLSWLKAEPLEEIKARKDIKGLVKKLEKQNFKGRIR